MQTLSEASIAYALQSEPCFEAALDHAERFTASYRKHMHATATEREAAALAVQFPALLLPPAAGDRFVGRIRYGLVGLSPEPVGLGYYCVSDALRTGAERYGRLSKRATTLLRFWDRITTSQKVRATFPPSVAKLLPSDRWTEDSAAAFPLYRLAGTVLDYQRLIHRGLPGLEAETANTRFAYVVPLLRSSIERYVADGVDDEIRETLQAIGQRPPTGLREAIQLFWLYALHAGTWNYGRLDVVLGPYLQRDLDTQRLTEAQALDLIGSLWRLMHAYSNQYNNRVIIGGRGRHHEAAADRFALLAIEASRRVGLNQPQLSLRWYQGQNPLLWERAIDAIGEGHTFPILYNDDVNVPAVAKAFSVPLKLAAQYTPFGCGEYVLGPWSVGSPNGVLNLVKALEIALHGGIDPVSGVRVLDLPDPATFTSFDQLWDAYTQVVDVFMTALAQQAVHTYRVIAAEAPFGFIGLLTGDCLESDRHLLSGGVRHLGATVETYGNTNTADSLYAVRQLVFEQRVLSLPELVASLDDNFTTDRNVQRRCLEVAKYGNDDAAVDAMAQRVHTQVCTSARRQAEAVSLDSCLVVIINNWANTVLGRSTAASPDGRRAGEPLANGNNPAPGADRSGVSAFLNSLVKLDPSLHAGAVQNMKFSKQWFGRMRPKFSALLQAYFAAGGTQAMVTVVSKRDLEAALIEPEKWSNLLVRVGGFSIRFVDLPPAAQRELIARTLH